MADPAGQVDDAAQRGHTDVRAVETAVARELLPGYEIVNETAVVPATEPEDEEPVS